MMENGNVWTFDKIAECAGAIRENMGRVIIGKQDVIKLVIAGLFAGEHILLDGYAGYRQNNVSKVLSKIDRCGVWADSIYAGFSPARSDRGGNVYHQKEEQFVFVPGPVFCNVLLAD